MTTTLATPVLPDTRQRLDAWLAGAHRYYFFEKEDQY